MSIIIERPLLDRFLESGGRRLLYGRRKTGKTFYARYRLHGYKYYITRPGGKIYDPMDDYEIDLRGFLRECREADKIILDEFHRADPKLFDALQAGECSGDLVLITSTLHYHKKYTVERNAPLKGLFKQVMVDLLSPVELLSTPGLMGRGEAKKLIEEVLYYLEPVLVNWKLPEIVESAWSISRSLIGEILDEEDAVYTRRIDGILEAVASGYTKLSEITSFLYSRGLIDKQSTGLVTKYLDQMLKYGLIERIPVYGKRKRSIYRHKSPLTATAYYLQSRYSYYDIPHMPDRGIKLASQITPLLIEQFIEKLLSATHGLAPVKILEPEIDIALVEYRKLKIVAEVKWRRNITRSIVAKIEEKLYSIDAEKRILIVPSKQDIPETSLEVIDIKDLMKIAVKWKQKMRKQAA